MERVDVAIVGAGQAGLSTSYELSQRGVSHVVLERGRVAQAWRDRWDSFRLVTPNWSVQLPGGAYDGDDPDGFMPRDELVEYFERYAQRIAAPVREGVDVKSIAKTHDGFTLDTSDGPIAADQVVLATGGYQRPYRPAGAAQLPAILPQFDLGSYRNQGQLPPGAVLIIGSGQTGCQIAEELVESGRDVFLSCGRAPWVPRRIGGRDVVSWALETGFLDAGVDTLPHPTARLIANVLNSGHKGGHDLNLRTLQRQGVRLLGRFTGVESNVLTFADDLAATVAWGDARYREFMGMVQRFSAERGWDVPEIAEPGPIDTDSPRTVDAATLGAVIFAGGLRPDYASWLPWPEAFDELGFPIHVDAQSTAVPGLWFMGVHFLRKRKSATLMGVGEDAAIVADGIARTLRSAA